MLITMSEKDNYRFIVLIPALSSLTNHSVHSIGVSLPPSTKALNIISSPSRRLPVGLTAPFQLTQWQKNSC